MIYLDPFPNRWAAGTFVVSFLAIIALTLAPFDFSFEDSVSLVEVVSQFSHRSSTDDWIANILLYTPLGFSLAAWLWAKRVTKSVQFTCVFFCALSLSITIEVLQAFLPLRESASTDIYANSVGGLLGLLCFNRWGQAATFDLFLSIERTLQRLIQRRIAALPIQSLTLLIVGYVLVLFLTTTHLQRLINFSNWTDPYFLLIGREQVVNSPWEGRISRLSIADRAVSEEAVAQVFAEKDLPKALQNALVASYDLSSYRDSYPDRTGHSPQLIWQGNSTQSPHKNSSFVNSAQWLSSETIASPINQKIRQSSQFALSAILATANPEQALPTPILSLSNQKNDLETQVLAGVPSPAVAYKTSSNERPLDQSAARRNLAFVQHGSDLVLWLRTSVGNGSGTKPELVIPNVFADTDFHHLLITYDNSRLRVYIDHLQNQFSFQLNPGIALFQKFLPLEELKNAGLVVSKVLYYVLLFAPLGVLTGLVLVMSKRRLGYRLVLLTESVVLAPLSLELLLMLKSGTLSWLSFLIGATVTATAILGVLASKK